MWKRWRRRTMAPGRPALYPDQIGLAAVIAVAAAIALYAVARALLG